MQDVINAFTTSKRVIAHLDMDAFFASVELLRYPQLRGLPVVIGGRKLGQLRPIDPEAPVNEWPRLHSYAGRGVVTTATYEARAFGVHSAMGIMKAASLAPEAIILPADFERYRHYSRLFKAAVAEIAPQIEDRGIDEIYIDLSDLAGIDEQAADDPVAGIRQIMQQIKDNVYQATGLRCSVGVSPNKLLSKIGSDLEKPNGLTILQASELQTRIWPLPVERINGVGPRTKEKLHELSIYTIGELAQADRLLLDQHFGSRTGLWMYQSARGIDASPVKTEREVKSVSRETTFERNLHVLHDKAELGAIFTRLCQQVSKDMQQKEVVGKNIGIKLRFDNFETVTRALTLPTATGDAAIIRRAAGRCLARVHFDRKIRLLGVRVGALSSSLSITPDTSGYEQGESLPLF